MMDIFHFPFRTYMASWIARMSLLWQGSSVISYLVTGYILLLLTMKLLKYTNPH
ncbi:hypothetical protein SAMN04487996_111236 [Dyadobacter soli]|uniref:Uncharacterized protein n=1 Tax=Dyadobacter soli TaxID=659014 RepID=A0A1G7ME81_9BACT|nr:hypothetical protein SAMN04487996_111236 [Dyadobacter soli]